MKKSFKVILCLILLAVVTAAFFACKDKNNTDVDNKQENNGGDEELCLHKFERYTIVTEPTKTTKGKAVSVCVNCKEEFNFTLLELGEVGYTTEDVDVDCEAGGTRKYTSEYGVFYEQIDPPGHDYRKTSGGKEAGCTTDGEEIYVCSRCGKEYTKKVSAFGHDYEITDEFDGDCNTNSFVEKTCIVCGDSFIDYGERKHKWGEGVHYKGNCTQYGYTRYECTECDEYTDVPDTRYSHEFDSADGICTLCGVECEHVFSGFVCDYCGFDIEKWISENDFYLADGNGNGEADAGESVYFGFYPRTHVRDLALIAKLKSLKSAEDGYYHYEKKRYARRTLNQKDSALATFEDGSVVANINIKDEDYFYRVEPVKWIVKNVEADGTLLLEAENVIDVMKFTEKVNPVDGEYYIPSDGENKYFADVWEHSDLRKTLNGSFVTQAFGEELVGYICDTINKNDDESGYYADLINSNNPDTTDKVFIASYSELFGADESMDNVNTERQKIATDFAIGGGAELSKSYDTRLTQYYTRSVGLKTSYVCAVNIDGTLKNSALVVDLYGVVPRIRVNFDK